MKARNKQKFKTRKHPGEKLQAIMTAVSNPFKGGFQFQQLPIIKYNEIDINIYRLQLTVLKCHLNFCRTPQGVNNMQEYATFTIEKLLLPLFVTVID